MSMSLPCRRYSKVRPSHALGPVFLSLWVVGFILFWTDGLSNCPPAMLNQVLGSAALVLVLVCISIYLALRVDDVIFDTQRQTYRRRQGWWRYLRTSEGSAREVRIRQTSYWTNAGADSDDVLVHDILFEFPASQPSLRIKPSQRDWRATPRPRDAGAVAQTAFRRICEEIGASVSSAAAGEGVEILPADPIPKSPRQLAVERGPSVIEKFLIGLFGAFFAVLGSGLAIFVWKGPLGLTAWKNLAGVLFNLVFTLGCMVAVGAGLLMINAAFKLAPVPSSEASKGSTADRQ